jgi:hypothetical protein
MPDVPAYLQMPLWVVSLLFFVAMMLARELGAAIKRKTMLAGGEVESFALTSVLGLLALFIGFTFSIALQRYDNRRELVVKEANALGTTWLRADLLDDQGRTALRDVLRRYVDARLRFGEGKDTAEEIAAYQESGILQAELWGTVMRTTAPFRDTPRASLLVTTTNESIDLAGERYANRQAHVPTSILRLLGLFALIAAAMVGYERGGLRRTTTVLFVMLTLAVTLVLDLDRPMTGMTTVSQQPMRDLQQSMRAP